MLVHIDALFNRNALKTQPQAEKGYERLQGLAQTEEGPQLFAALFQVNCQTKHILALAWCFQELGEDLTEI